MKQPADGAREQASGGTRRSADTEGTGADAEQAAELVPPLLGRPQYRADDDNEDYEPL